MSVKRKIAKAMATLLLGVVIAGNAAPTASFAESGDNPCYKHKSTERSFVSKMNKARNSAGKSNLSLDPELSKAAKKHTFEMVKKDLLHHTPSDQLQKRITKWSTLGENVGFGGDVDSLHKAFMNSPAHKANILFSSFKHVGVGVVKKDDLMWVTVIFEAAVDPGTTLKMPKC